MCVNDLIVRREPLFFSTISPPESSMSRPADDHRRHCRGLRAVGCAWRRDGRRCRHVARRLRSRRFAVGAVERDAVLTGAGVIAGDVVRPPQRLHSKDFLWCAGSSRMPVSTTAPPPLRAGDQPRRGAAHADSFTSEAVWQRSAWRHQGARAHHGGGLIENIPRVLPRISRPSSMPPLDAAAGLPLLATTAGLDHYEMARTFNCGIGMSWSSPRSMRPHRPLPGRCRRDSVPHRRIVPRGDGEGTDPQYGGAMAG